MTLLDILPSLRSAGTPRLDPSVWPISTHYDDMGRLCVGDVALSDVADQYGTPSYVIDESDFRFRARQYRTSLREAEIAYAAKAMLTKSIATWIGQERLSLDVCSGGELATALAAGIDQARIIAHGNAKRCEDLRYAVAAGVGRIVLDSHTEITLLSAQLSKTQRVLVRVTPDIDIHGHHAVTTGVADQKFGFGLYTGQAMDAIRRVIADPKLELVGLHCHIGSQVTDPELYAEAIRRMIAAMADVHSTHGVRLTELNIGGGHGVAYRPGDAQLDVKEFAATVEDAMDEACASERFPRPHLTIEPGRAIAARSGVTVYRVVSVKHSVTTDEQGVQRPGRTFVAIDGGMSDNPRVTLYDAKYTAALVNRHPAGPTSPATIVGRHCESGDEIVRDIALPSDIHPGDVIAVPCTGAYHHSMASTYNMVCRPPVVAVRAGRTTQLVRRETIDDLLARDLG